MCPAMIRHWSHARQKGWGYPPKKTACQSGLRFQRYKPLKSVTTAGGPAGGPAGRPLIIRFLVYISRNSLRASRSLVIIVCDNKLWHTLWATSNCCRRLKCPPWRHDACSLISSFCGTFTSVRLTRHICSAVSRSTSLDAPPAACRCFTRPTLVSTRWKQGFLIGSLKRWTAFYAKCRRQMCSAWACALLKHVWKSTSLWRDRFRSAHS